LVSSMTYSTSPFRYPRPHSHSSSVPLSANPFSTSHPSHDFTTLFTSQYFHSLRLCFHLFCILEAFLLSSKARSYGSPLLFHTHLPSFLHPHILSSLFLHPVCSRVRTRWIANIELLCRYFWNWYRSVYKCKPSNYHQTKAKEQQVGKGKAYRRLFKTTSYLCNLSFIVEQKGQKRSVSVSVSGSSM